MRLQGKAILILPDYNPEKTKGGIINPVEVKAPDSGKVLECGAGCEITSPGDQVQYKRKGAHVIHIDGVEQHFIIEEQIYFNHGQ